jgi:hypothetical protein
LYVVAHNEFTMHGVSFDAQQFRHANIKMGHEEEAIM